MVGSATAKLREPKRGRRHERQTQMNAEYKMGDDMVTITVEQNHDYCRQELCLTYTLHATYYN